MSDHLKAAREAFRLSKEIMDTAAALPQKRAMDRQRLASMIDAYIDTMLWAETDDDGTPLDEDYASYDLSDEAKADIEEDCADFLGLLERVGCRWESEMPIESLAHDFYLTRNGHGTGFWDRDYDDDTIGEALDNWSKTYGTQGLYVGDDGLLYTHS